MKSSCQAAKILVQHPDQCGQQLNSIQIGLRFALNCNYSGLFELNGIQLELHFLNCLTVGPEKPPSAASGTRMTSKFAKFNTKSGLEVRTRLYESKSL